MTDYSIFLGGLLDTNTFLINDQTEITRNDLVRTYTNQSQLGTIIIRNSQYSYITMRSVQRLVTFIAFMGGIFNSLYALIGLFMNVYCRYQLWLKLFKINYTIILQNEHQNKGNDKKSLNRLSSTGTRYYQKHHSELTKR